MLSVWTEPETTLKRVTAAVVLPSGVGRGEFLIQIIDGGECLELSVTWPQPLVDVELMHRRWLQSVHADRMQSYHPKIIGFQNSLRNLKGKVTEDVKSVARILFPFPVQSHIAQKDNLAWIGNDARVIYIEMKQVQLDDYSKVNDNDNFVMS
ncbi:hypothetical protein BWQ96_08037 [Gracilariopsis chorda]|uniref:Uncharacterized protein n=1 Tax=Gracilariopsis chorda TaxID=448386 RepID=A0A2V3IJJ8_9FLOR|nr:hypothetical protein BWQ96_08037 [Gracilariopsis chorda]|eukprot:PXF42241.1 hypothetical protein BWQ96_08037 [Gracilariopsis chorda]